MIGIEERDFSLSCPFPQLQSPVFELFQLPSAKCQLSSTWFKFQVVNFNFENSNFEKVYLYTVIQSILFVGKLPFRPTHCHAMSLDILSLHFSLFLKVFRRPLKPDKAGRVQSALKRLQVAGVSSQSLLLEVVIHYLPQSISRILWQCSKDFSINYQVHACWPIILCWD